MKIRVTFYKEKFDFSKREAITERVEFVHECDKTKSDYDNYAEAFDKACQLGHNPSKSIHYQKI